MLNYDDLDIFGEQLINVPQTENKYDVMSFVYQPNYQNIDVL